MAQKNQLTNEKITKAFSSNFELAKYAMRLARYKIAAGEGATVDPLLAEIARHPHQYTHEELGEMTVAVKAHRDHQDERSGSVSDA